jgi:hypothetical protein
MGGIDAVTKAITAIGNATGWQLVGAVTAAGTISMAFLQLVKDLAPIRRVFQRHWITRWVAQHAEDYNRDRKQKGADKNAPPEVSPDKAQTLLVELATGGDDHAFYELAIEQMVAQMNAAVQITLDYPKQYSDLLVVISEGAELDDVSAVISHSPTGARGKRTAPGGDYLEARARVSHRIQRNLDAIQISLGSRWRFCMQLTALVLSTTLLEGAVLSVAGPNLGTALIALLIGIVGGYLAPVTRDLVAALQTLRK